MNDPDIKTILTELYSIDPDLKPREREIVAILRTLALKPSAKYDAAFATELRTRLLTELERKAEPRTLFSIFAANNLRYSLAGLFILVLVGVVAVFVTIRPGSGGSSPVALLPSNATITHVGNNAFGALGHTTTGAASDATSGASENASVRQGAAAKAISSPAASPMIATAMPAYINPTVKYSYTGATFTQDKAQLDVLKKIATPLNADQANAALLQTGFGQIALSTFDGLGMSNVTLSENRSFGYQVNIDFENGTVSINQNYNEWPQGDTTPLTASKIPSDDAAIAVANRFFADHHIPLSSYGAPTVTKTQLAIPVAEPQAAGTASKDAATAMPMIPYYPDSKQVLYPLMVNGLPVYNSNGTAVGLTAEVNIRYDRVASVYGLETQTYQASAYDAITNIDTILSMAENPARFIYPLIYNGAAGSSASGAGDATTVTTYDLGTPIMAYAEIYQTDASGTNSEFLVPAFVFPVMGNEASTDQRIVVPLIKDFVQNDPPIRVMPYNGSVNGATATSSPAQPPIPQ